MTDNVVTTLASSSLMRSSIFIQVTRTTIKAWMSLNLKQNKPQAVELTALELLDLQ